MSKCAQRDSQRDASKHIRRIMQEHIQPAKGDQGSGNEGGDTRLSMLHENGCGSAKGPCGMG